MKLNPHQQQAVNYLSGPLLVLAGAGSGKTRVITEKIAYLIRDCEIKARHIYAVTFTNKAANEMQKRVSTLLKGKTSHGLSISTFHALGLQIIRQEHALLGFKKQFSIFDSFDSVSLLRDLIKQSKLSIEAEYAQQQISQWKNGLITPESALKEPKDTTEQAVANLYEQYEKTLRAYNAVDFDNLISTPVNLLKTNPEARQRWQEKIHYLLVDEYQDTNLCQYELIKLLTGLRQQFTVVGDDDQSIYAWRGANAENLNTLSQDYPSLEVIKLEQNYRSYGRILKVANHLISHNPHVFEKKLWSSLGFGDLIRIIRCRSDIHEASRVASEIASQQFKQRNRYGEYAILYRSNFQARLFEEALRDQQIPYHLSGGLSFFERSEIKDILAYLRLLVNPDDDSAFLRVVNLPRRGIGAQTIEALNQYAHSRECSLLIACQELGLENRLSASAYQTLNEFALFLKQKTEALNVAPFQSEDPEILTVKKILLELLEDIGYETWLYDNEKLAKSAEKKMQQIFSFFDWLDRLAAKENEASFSEILNKVILIDRLNSDNEEQKEDCVQLMTLHAAKGLEFPHVFLVGMEEELLPHRSSINEDNITEERRLAYVGVTRAQKTLTITLASARKKQGSLTQSDPSRFLSEMPPEDLEYEGEGFEKDPIESAKKAKTHLADLKALLAE